MRTQEKGNAALSKNIRYLLDKHGETITSLSRVLHITRQSVAQYVDGKGQPNADKLLAIAEHFGVSVDYLLGRTDTPTTDADARACCDYTGLSQEAIDRLHTVKECPIPSDGLGPQIQTAVINTLLEHKAGRSALEFMGLYLFFNYNAFRSTETGEYIISEKVSLCRKDDPDGIGIPISPEKIKSSILVDIQAMLFDLGRDIEGGDDNGQHKTDN